MITIKRKAILLCLGIMMALCLLFGFVTSNIYAFAETAFYNADKTPLTWVYDSNGVSKQVAYKADGSKYGMNGMYNPAGCYGEQADGSVFVLTSGSYIVLAPQDVTKEIELSFTMDPNNAWSGQDANLGRFLLAAYDNMENAFAAGNSAWQNANNEKFTAWGALKVDNENMHKLNIGGQKSKEINYNGGNAVFTIKVGETSTDFYFGGDKFATTALKRSDFASGKMYISLISYDANLEAKVKLSAKDVVAETTKYYNADKTPLTWAYDSNGVSTQTAYDAAGNKYGSNGMYSPAGCYGEQADGSVFVLTAGSYIVLAPQDVTKEIEFSFTMDPNNAWSGQDATLGRFLLAAYDNMDNAFAAGNNAWQGANNEKFTAWGALKANDNQHKLLIENQRSKAVNYNGGNAVLTIKVGETGTDFYFGGEKFATTALKRSDFESGQMYISLIAFDAVLEAKVKVSAKEATVVTTKYYNADKTPLTWAYDANGVSTQTAYKADGSKYGSNGMYSPANCYRENADGSVFLLTAGSYTVFKPQDVTKDIVFSFTMDPNNAWSNNDTSLGRFLLAAYDNMDDAFAAGNNAWQNANNEKFTAWGALKEGESNKHKLEVSWQKSKEVNYNGNNAVFTVKVGETGTDFYFGGEKFATTALKRSDFASGQMYLSLIAYDANLEAKVKLINCDHAEKAHTAAKAATCTEAGNVAYYFCAQCNQYFADAACEMVLKANELTIAVLGHTEEVVAGKAATCTEKGLTDGKRCSVCETTIVAQEEIEALGHTEGDWIIDSEAQVGVAGSKHKECTVCEEVLVTEEIPALEDTTSEEPEDPTTSEEPEDPTTSEDPSDTTSDVPADTTSDVETEAPKGCSGSVSGLSVGVMMLGVGVVAMLCKKRKE